VLIRESCVPLGFGENIQHLEELRRGEERSLTLELGKSLGGCVRKRLVTPRDRSDQEVAKVTLDCNKRLLYILTGIDQLASLQEGAM